MVKNCPLCTHPLQAQIEAEYVRNEKSVDDIIELLGPDKIDILGVLIHFEDHQLALEKAAEKKQAQRRIKEVEEQEVEITSTVEPTLQGLKSDRLEKLTEIYSILESKFYEIMATKQIAGLSQISKELRETMREIDRVKKEEKASLADRTADLFKEHRDMNRWLLFNLCVKCKTEYEKWLKGAEIAGKSVT